MADIRLADFVLLECDFELWPERADEEPSEAQDDTGEEVFEYPEEDLLDLAASTAAAGDDYVLYLRADLDDPRLPFRLGLMLGARFVIREDEEGPPPSVEDVEPTLVWLCYPYLRETVASITNRSPLPPYMLPALTRMPHPSVLGHEAEE